jgi:hypothetical protein
MLSFTQRIGKCSYAVSYTACPPSQKHALAFGAFYGQFEEMPILAASEIYRQLGMQLPQEFKMITYDALLVSESSYTACPPSQKHALAFGAFYGQFEEMKQVMSRMKSMTRCWCRNLHP